jgi:NAD(P)-dependent dehydrogenase (short-subunit alcohol dehydrogenase family)
MIGSDRLREDADERAQVFPSFEADGQELRKLEQRGLARHYNGLRLDSRRACRIGGPMTRLANKVALISGGASRPGIGSATAQRFAEEGAIVYLGDLDLAATEQVARDIRASGGQAFALRLDVRSEDDWRAAANRIEAEQGRLDVLVNNAGIAMLGPFAEQTHEILDRTLEVNLKGVFLGMQTAVALMRKTGKGGSIVNISSVAGLIGAPLTLAYSATKAGVLGMSRCAAVELAPERIRVNTIHPGNTMTNMIKGAMDANPGLVEATTAGVPMKVMIEPIDIANGALFLASDESRYMTGAMLVIDGGMSID